MIQYLRRLLSRGPSSVSVPQPSRAQAERDVYNIIIGELVYQLEEAGLVAVVSTARLSARQPRAWTTLGKAPDGQMILMTAATFEEGAGDA